MDEIARLTASCQEHEREIRASQVSWPAPSRWSQQLMRQTTIKRKLQDFSQNFDALTELDNQAEVRLHSDAPITMAILMILERS
jgi:hypothetical protein